MLEATLQTLHTPSMPRLATAHIRAAVLFGKFRMLRTRSRLHKALRDLTIEQLVDTGIDPAAGSAPKPTIEIKAGLLANLASMR